MNNNENSTRGYAALSFLMFISITFLGLFTTLNNLVYPHNSYAIWQAKYFQSKLVAFSCAGLSAKKFAEDPHWDGSMNSVTIIEHGNLKGQCSTGVDMTRSDELRKTIMIGSIYGGVKAHAEVEILINPHSVEISSIKEL